MNKKRVIRIFIWLIAAIVLLAGIVFAAGYFYYGKILKNYITDAVEKESNGLYHATMADVSLNLLDGNLTLKQFTITPDTALYRVLSQKDTLPPLLFAVSIDQFKVRDFNVKKAFFQKRIEMKKIVFEAPGVTLYRMRLPDHAKKATSHKKLTSIPLPRGLAGIVVKELIIDSAHIEFIDCIHDTATIHTFPVADIHITNIQIDSTGETAGRFFNTDDISVRLGGYSFMSKNGMNKLSFGEIGLSTAKGEVYVKNFHLEPQYNQHDYSRKLGFQTDRMEIRAGDIRVNRLNIPALLFQGKVMAGLVSIDSLLIDDYRDKRVPPRKGFKPPMPQELIRGIRHFVVIDTIQLKNGKALYSEQVGNEPGSLYFDQMQAIITGFTTDSALLVIRPETKVQGTLWLMGKGKLDATVIFRFNDPGNHFTMSATMAGFDLREINPMLTKLVPARVVGGRVDKLEVPMVFANNELAQGHLRFYYSDLDIEVTNTDTTNWSKVKNKAINFAANDLVVNNSNPSKSGKLHTGTIHFVRDKEKGIINFIWKSMLSGLKSTMGFNSKAQKEMIKAEKDAGKAHKKEHHKKK
jgi:hypothetical protein